MKIPAKFPITKTTKDTPNKYNNKSKQKIKQIQKCSKK